MREKHFISENLASINFPISIIHSDRLQKLFKFIELSISLETIYDLFENTYVIMKDAKYGTFINYDHLLVILKYAMLDEKEFLKKKFEYKCDKEKKFLEDENKKDKYVFVEEKKNLKIKLFELKPKFQKEEQMEQENPNETKISIANVQSLEV